MFNNLLAEMQREMVGAEAMANELKIAKRTLLNKIYGRTQFNCDEMFMARDIFFPDLGVEFLFTKYDGEPDPKLINFIET